MAARRLPSRTMQTRSTSREMRVPGGNSSGLPMAKRELGPYVTCGLKKSQSETAASAAEPKRPTLASHEKIRRRDTFSGWLGSGLLGFLLASAICFLLRGIHQFLHIAPEHLVFGVLNIAEIVFLHGENKYTRGGQRSEER